LTLLLNTRMVHASPPDRSARSLDGILDAGQRVERIIAYDEPSYGFVSMAVVGSNPSPETLNPSKP